MQQTVTSAKDMKNLAQNFLSELKPTTGKARVVGLYGDLGAGKTTFTQAVADILGVSDNVVSPTFVIMKIYELTDKPWKHLVHIDAYRLEKSSELVHLGWNDLISQPDNLILIEWPERVTDIMPEHVKITFNHKAENERNVDIHFI